MINTNEVELVNMLMENPNEAKDIIYKEYSYIIDIIIKKYSRVIKMFSIDEEEVKCEASCGFSDGINCYLADKNASLKTFLSLCVERKVTKYLSKFTNNKAKLLNDTLSLESTESLHNTPIIDLISDDSKHDPLNSLTSFESLKELIDIGKKCLSDFEFKVFTYMANEVSYQEIAKILDKTPKQIDNTMQRIKFKMRKELEQ